VLHPIGGRDKAIKAGELHEQTYQANTTGPHCCTHQVYPEHQTMQESQPGDTVEKGHDGGMLIKAVAVCLPGLQRAAGDSKLLGGLTLRDALGL